MSFQSMCRCLGLVIVAFVLCSFSAQPAVVFYDNAGAFAAATSNLSTNNFEGLVTTGFHNYDGLTTGGVTYTASGTGPFGTGEVTVLSAPYAAGQSAVYNTGTGAILIYTPPNEPGTAYLSVLLPENTTAVGTNLWAVQPYITTMHLRVYLAHEEVSENLDLTTVTRPTSSFFGVTSDTPMTALEFHFPQGQVGVILDNFRIGDAGATQADSTVPEPATIMLAGAALLGVGLLRRSKRA